MNLPAEIVEIREGKPMVSSLQVAEKFKKQHNNVLRAIHDIDISEEFSALNFEQASYTDAQNKQRPMYWMTRDGFWALTMTFSGAEARKLREGIINALNKAEEVDCINSLLENMPALTSLRLEASGSRRMRQGPPACAYL